MSPEQQQLVTANLGLVRKVAWSYRWTGREYEDLFQVGCLGLIRAAKAYDPVLGNAFSSIAWPCITNAIIGNAHNLPDALEASSSLDEPAYAEEPTTLSELLPAIDPSPEDTAVAGHVHRLLEKLDEREATILRMRFGLVDGIERTCEEVGRLLGVSKVRVSQIERKALTRLRSAVL